MKKILFIITIILSIALFVSCKDTPTVEEKEALYSAKFVFTNTSVEGLTTLYLPLYPPSPKDSCYSGQKQLYTDEECLVPSSFKVEMKTSGANTMQVYIYSSSEVWHSGYVDLVNSLGVSFEGQALSCLVFKKGTTNPINAESGSYTGSLVITFEHDTEISFSPR